MPMKTKNRVLQKMMIKMRKNKTQIPVYALPKCAKFKQKTLIPRQKFYANFFQRFFHKLLIS